MRGLSRRILCLLTAVVVLTCGPSPAAGSTRPTGEAFFAAYGPKRVPVILIHGLASSPQVWGWSPRRADRAGLYQELLNDGYTEGLDLFVLDYSDNSNPDYVDIAQEELHSLVQGLLAQGASRVDLVGHSYGGLIARYYAARVNPDRVRKLVLVGAPNHGSYAATAVRLQGELDRQVELRGSGVPVVKEHASEQLPPFVCATQYVKERVDSYYSPLFRRFSQESLFSQEPATRAGRESFESWLGTAMPGWHETIDLLAARKPQVHKLPSGECPDVPGGRGYEAGLTLGYYELLALNAARAVELRYSPVVNELLQGALKDFEIRPTWQETLVHFVTRRLLALAESKGVQVLTSNLRSWFIGGVEAWAGVDATGAALSRLVSEDVLLQHGGAAGGATSCRANQFLVDWNQDDALENLGYWPGRQTLHVVGWASSPWPLLMSRSTTQPTDLVVGVEQALLPLSVNDEVVLVRDWQEGLHTELVRNRSVCRDILDFLTGGPPALEMTAAWSSARVEYLKASRLEPGARPGTDEYDVELRADVADLRKLASEDYALALWWQPLGSGSSSSPGGLTLSLTHDWTRTDSWWDNLWGTRTRTVRLPAISGPGRYELRARLVSSTSSQPELHWGESGLPVSQPATSTLAHPPGLDLQLRVATGGDNASTASAAPGGEPSTKNPESPPEPQIGDTPGEPHVSDEPVGTGPAPSDDEPASSGPEVIEQLDSDVPLVRVVYHSKQTTLKREKRTYHSTWEWDFGDGSTRVIEGAEHAHVELGHTFPRAGHYQVRAVSHANDGRLLRDISWDISLDAGPGGDIDLVRHFEAWSVEEPVVKLAVTGPVKWVTGKPARYRVNVEVEWPEHVQKAFVRMYPAPEFDVRWERPGTFTVRGAVYLRISYAFDGENVTVYNTYVAEQEVEVLATTVH